MLRFSNTFCAGCFTKFGIDDPDKRQLQPGLYTHSGCVEKARKNERLKVQGAARIQAAMNDLSRQSAELFDRTGLNKLRVPDEVKKMFDVSGDYTAREFARVLSKGLSKLSAACGNGKSEFREEIAALARRASVALNDFVEISREETVPSMAAKAKDVGRQAAASASKHIGRATKAVAQGVAAARTKSRRTKKRAGR